MVDFATERWQNMLTKVRAKGAAVSFSGETGAYNETSDRFDNPAASVINGSAAEIPGDPDEYIELELIQLSPITLVFAPDTINQAPDIGFTFTWAGVKRTVKHIFPYRPNGVFLGGRILAT